MKINRKISDFSGEHLIIGCGADHDHYFHLTDEEAINSTDLHPAKDYYTISLDSDCSPDIEADFLNRRVSEYLAGRKFDTICFEVTTGMLLSNAALEQAVAQAKELLTDDGMLFIFRCDREHTLAKQAVLTKYFNHGYNFYSSTRGIWSALISNTAIDLAGVKASDSYFAKLLQNFATEDTHSLTDHIEDSAEALETHKEAAEDGYCPPPLRLAEEKPQDSAAAGGGYSPPPLRLAEEKPEDSAAAGGGYSRLLSFFSPSSAASAKKPTGTTVAIEATSATIAAGAKL